LNLLNGDAKTLQASAPKDQVVAGARPSRLFRAGEAIALDAGKVVILENPGSARLDLLLIVVEQPTPTT
jgi:hypothetical protein